MSSSSKEGLLALCGSFLALTTAAVGLRFYARKEAKLRWLSDDWMTIPALVAYIGAAVCVFVAVHHKELGYSSTDFTHITPAQSLTRAKEIAQLSVAFDVFTNVALACTKISALLFYRRLFCVVGGGQEKFEVVIFITVAVVALWSVTFTILPGLQCGTHFSALWDGPTFYLKYCKYSFAYVYGFTISDFLLDIWILLIPLPSIIGLQTTWSKKSTIFGIFLLTFVGLGASIARLVTVVRVELEGAAYFSHVDEERADTQTDYFIMLEVGISLIAVNLPSMWLLWTALPAKISSSLRHIVSATSSSGQGSRGSHRDNASKGDGSAGSGKDHEISSRGGDSAPSLHQQRSVPAYYTRNEMEGRDLEEAYKHDIELVAPWERNDPDVLRKAVVVSSVEDSQH